MEDPGQVNLEDLSPEEREAFELKIQLQEKRQAVCDTSLFEQAQNAESVQLKLKRRRDLKGHLTKVKFNILLFIQKINQLKFVVKTVTVRVEKSYYNYTIFISLPYS